MKPWRTQTQCLPDPGNCQIILFPTTKRAGKIRTTADKLAVRQGKEADRYWRQVIDGMRSQMERSGATSDAIERELRDFSGAVFGYIHSMADQPDDGAA